jgi:hypothetical protein
MSSYLGGRGDFRTLPFDVGRFVVMSSRDSVGGGPYLVEEAYPLGWRNSLPSLDTKLGAALAQQLKHASKPSDAAIIGIGNIGPAAKRMVEKQDGCGHAATRAPGRAWSPRWNGPWQRSGRTGR